MPKINVYLPDSLAEAVRDAQLPVSSICQAALERAVRDVTSARSTDRAPAAEHQGRGMLGRFTPRARQALVLAEAAAHDAAHVSVGTEHVLLGVIDEGNNLALTVLDSIDIEPSDVRAELVASMPGPDIRVEGHIAFSPLSKRALELTATEALGLGHNYIGCEHLLLGVLATEDGIASHVLRRMGLELRTTRRAVVSALGSLSHVPRKEASTPPVDHQATLDEILQRLEAIERRLAS